MTMHRALPIRLLLAAALLVPAGCDGAGSSDPLPPGRYLYRASHPVPTGADSIHLTGVLVISDASGEVAGHWDVPQLHPELTTLEAEDGSMVIGAQPTYFGNIAHRVSAAGGTVRCEGEYTWIAEGGQERSLPVACSLSPNVPEGYDPAVPAPASRAVRPLDADTLPPRQP